MDPEFVQVRIRREQHDRLCEYIDSLHKLRDQGVNPYGHRGPGGKKISFSDALMILLNKIDEHRERARKSRDGQAAERRALQLAAACEPEGLIEVVDDPADVDQEDVKPHRRHAKKETGDATPA